MKDNYGKIALLVTSILAVSVAVFVLLRSFAFSEAFQSLGEAAGRGDKLPALNVQALTDGSKALSSPAEWAERRGSSLMVSQPYLVREGVLVNPLAEGSAPIHPPVENVWFTNNDLDILSPGILEEDTDGDKFSNLDEFNYKTDPQDPKSTPPLHLLLSLKREDRKPNRLSFRSYTEDTFTVNTNDIRQPTQFVAIGNQINNTKLKVLSFALKSETRDLGNGTQVEKDVSELVVENIENGQKFTLIKDTVVDTGDSTVILGYGFDNSEISLKRDQEFSLPPDASTKYRLVETRMDGAVIEKVGAGEKIIVPPAPTEAAPAATESR